MTAAAETEVCAKVSPGRYRHYKGRDYEVLGVARHSETDEALVVYRCLYGDFSLWVRPLTMFVEILWIDGRPRPRFVRVESGEGETGFSGGDSFLPPGI